MFLFHCDLDNTLIYSYKHDIGENKILVETKEEKELSYMTVFTYEKLQELVKKLEFIPTTTRTIEQYQRIQLGIPTPRYALVANGGVLLENGQIEKTWYQESLDRIAPYMDILTQGEQLLKEDTDVNFEVLWIEKLFIFTKSAKPEETAEKLINALDCDEVEVHTNGTKVYILPNCMSKGEAVHRMSEKLNPKFVLSAGDSLFDCSMLRASQQGFAPFSLASQNFDNNWFISPEQSLFSEVLLEEILKEKYNGVYYQS